MNPMIRMYTTVAAVILIATGIVGAQVASDSSGPARTTPAAPQSVSVSTPAETSLNRLHSALTLSTFGSSNTSTTVFVVPAQQMTNEELTAITEDVNVMARIFENKLSQANLVTPRGRFPIFVGTGYRGPFGGQDNLPRSMYLQGYGLLFMIDVDFPLAPGPEVESEETTQPDTDVDPVWAKTRQEIYEPQRLDTNSGPEESAPKYSAEQVESLKTTIVKALVHAANIRSLTPDETVIVTVTGSSASDIVSTQTIAIPGTGQVVVKGRNDEFKIVEGPLPDNSGTLLTIRVKSANIKALAEGNLTEEQFRQRVQILSHPLLSAAASASPTFPVTTGRRRTSNIP